RERRGNAGEGRHGQQGDGGQAPGVPGRGETGRRRRARRQRPAPRVRYVGQRKGHAARLHTGGEMRVTLDDIRTREQQHVLQTYKRQPVVFVRGQGSRLYDADGREYLDLLTGIGVASLGHAHPGLTAIVKEQAETLLHTSNLYYHPFQAQAAAKLAQLSGLQRAFFCNSGTEANEANLKFARRYWHTLAETRRIEYVAVETASAGRTMGALSVTHDPHYREPFMP